MDIDDRYLILTRLADDYNQRKSDFSLFCKELPGFGEFVESDQQSVITSEF